MNGALISSWGVNLQDRPSEGIHRALYPPSEHYSHKDNGVVLKPPGVEARSFYFVPGAETKSVADDGGLIEVQVFRAEGRNKQAFPEELYRSQEKYGIV